MNAWYYDAAGEEVVGESHPWQAILVADTPRDRAWMAAIRRKRLPMKVAYYDDMGELIRGQGRQPVQCIMVAATDEDRQFLQQLRDATVTEKEHSKLILPRRIR